MSDRKSGSEDDTEQEITLEEWITRKQSLTNEDTVTDVEGQESDDDGVVVSAFVSIRSLIQSAADVIREQTITQRPDEKRQAYIRAISDVDASLDRVVTASDIERETEYTVAEIAETFGGWRQALDAAGIDVRSQVGTEILRLYQELGHPPSPAEMNDHGHISATFVENTFESYDSAISQAVAETETATEGSVLSEITDTVRSGIDDVGRLTKQAGRCVEERLKQSRGAIDRVFVRFKELHAPGALSEWRGHLFRESGALRRRIPNPTGYLSSLRDTTPEVNQERRALLKYAGTSLTISTAVSSSNSLYGTDVERGDLVAYGYGGIPVTASINASRERQARAMTPTPDETETPSAGAVTAPTPGETETPSVEEVTAPTPDETETTSVEEATTSTPTSTPVPETTTVEEPTTSTESPSPTETETTSEPDTATEASDTAVPTTDTEDVQTSRYYSDFSVPQQGYGEEGYGGVATT